MVANLLRLRLLLFKNSLLRSTWQLVAVIVGGLYGLGMLITAVVGLGVLSVTPVELARTIVIMAGSTLVIAWVVVPLLVTGVDQSLDTARLVSFPIPVRTLVIALTLAGFCGIPGLVTLLVSAATALTWWQHPAIACAALVCGALAAVTCVIASRAITTLGSTLTSGRRYREIAGFLVFIPVLLLGPIILTVSSGIQKSLAALPGVADVLSWSPIGALWAVPSELAVGHLLQAALKFAIGIAFLVFLIVVWQRSLGIALVSPPHSATRKRQQGKLGWFSRLPATPAGAVAARALTYWVRDPRYSRQLLVVPLIPVMMLFYSRGGSLSILVATGPIVALLLSLSIFADLSYEGTAFTAQVSSGLTGRDDRLGRAAALGGFGLPIVLVFVVASAAISGSWSMLVALLGLTVGIFLTGLGVSSVSSAFVLVPVPAPGDNPFRAAPGVGFTSIITTFATWGVLGVLVLPELAFVITAAVTGLPVFGWITLALGILLGSVFLIAGIRIGGARLDRTAPDLLERLAKAR